MPRAWVESHHGIWDHGDWLGLVATLRLSDYWPLNLAAVGELLEEQKRCYANLLRWQLSRHARSWVDLRHGIGTTPVGRRCSRRYRQSEFWPMNPQSVAECSMRCAASGGACGAGGMRAWPSSGSRRTRGNGTTTTGSPCSRRCVQPAIGRWSRRHWAACSNRHAKSGATCVAGWNRASPAMGGDARTPVGQGHAAGVDGLAVAQRVLATRCAGGAWASGPTGPRACESPAVGGVGRREPLG